MPPGGLTYVNEPTPGLSSLPASCDGLSSMSGRMPIVDASVQETNAWLKAIARELGGGEKQDAYAAARAVLQSLRDHLPPQAALTFAGELPLALRGALVENWQLGAPPLRNDPGHTFAEDVGARLGAFFVTDAEGAARAVLAVIDRKVPRSVLERTLDQLPPGMLPFGRA